MERLRRAYPEFDRRLGGGQPPSKALRFLARHPVVVGAVVGVFDGLLCAWVLSGFGDARIMLQAGLWGLGFGLFFWGLCRAERWRQNHYERTVGWRTAPPPPVVAREAPPLWAEGVHWVGLWSILTGVLWLLGQFRDPPDGLPWSAIEAGLVVVGSRAVRRAAERRRRRD